MRADRHHGGERDRTAGRDVGVEAICPNAGCGGVAEARSRDEANAGRPLEVLELLDSVGRAAAAVHLETIEGDLEGRRIVVFRRSDLDSHGDGVEFVPSGKVAAVPWAVAV